MKIVVLRGGAAPLRRAGQAATTEAPGAGHNGVTAIGDGLGQWALLNLSAAVAHQLETDRSLDTHGGLGADGPRTVVITDVHLDHVGGLLSLRDGPPIELYATPSAFEALTSALPILPVLQSYCGVHWHVVPVSGDRPVASFRIDHMPSLEFTAIATNAPPAQHAAPGEHPRVGDSIVLAVRDLHTGQRAFCAPGNAPTSGLALDWMQDADCVLADGPSGSGWLEQLAGLPAPQKLLIGVLAHSPTAPPQGLRLAHDGLAIQL
jgi:pyrroloquinoline quinone biosynthesis protein B